MATFRVGVGSFNINDGSVGIGTEGSGHGNLKVEGTLKSTSADVLGVSTFIRYSGFNADNVSVSNRDLTLSGEYSTTGDIVVGDGASLTVGLGSTACVGTVECISVKHHFSVPVGDTAQRNETSGYAEGTVRYNRDLGTMEFFNGNEWRQFAYISDMQNSSSSRGRGLVFGGYPAAGGQTSIIDYINIQSQGNALFFGDLLTATRMGASCSSNTRGLNAGVYPTSLNEINYVTMASKGNGVDFGGGMSVRRQQLASLSSQTRGIFAGGASPSTNAANIIDFVEINTLGQAVDFGDLQNGRRNTRGAASPTRGIVTAGGEAPNFVTGNEFITIAAKGNAVDFGAVNGTTSGIGAGSNGVRGIFAGGYNPTKLDKISHVTMASLGNVVNFGNLSIARQELQVLPDKTRAVFTGGWGPAPSPANVINTMDFILFSSGGSAEDFGDLSAARAQVAGCTDSHGGLGGY